MRIDRSFDDLPAIRRGKKVVVKIDGKEVEAFEGEMVSTVLQEIGIRNFGRNNPDGRRRGIYCGMGICYECLLTIDGCVVRACQTAVAEGMQIETRSEVAL